MESPPEGDDGGDDDENGYPPLVLSEQEIDRLLDMIIPQSVMDRHNPFLPGMNEEAAQRQITHLATKFPLMSESHRRTLSGRMFDRGRPLSRDTVRAWLVDFFDEDRMMAILDDELHAVLSTLIQAFRMQQRAQNIAGLVNEDQTQEGVETQPDQLTANHQKISEDHTQKCSENHRDETAMDSQRISEDSTQEGGENQSNGTANTVATSTRKKGKSFSDSSIHVQAAKQNYDAVFAGIDDSEKDLPFFPAETSLGGLPTLPTRETLREVNLEGVSPEDWRVLVELFYNDFCKKEISLYDAVALLKTKQSRLRKEYATEIAKTLIEIPDALKLLCFEIQRQDQPQSFRVKAFLAMLGYKCTRCGQFKKGCGCGSKCHFCGKSTRGVECCPEKQKNRQPSKCCKCHRTPKKDACICQCKKCKLPKKFGCKCRGKKSKRG
jgi:hypothetical protein